MIHLILYTCVAVGILCSAMLVAFLRKRSRERESKAGAWLQLSLGLAAAFAIAELCARLAMAILSAHETRPTSFDAELGWSRPPQNRVELSSEDGSGDGDARIVFVGDSVAFGQGVAAEQSMVHQARLHLETSDLATSDLETSGLSVLNAAVSGFGIDQTNLYVKRHLPTWKNLEILVFVVFAGNDLADTASNMRYGHSKPLFRHVDGNLQPSTARLSRYSRRNLVTRSRLVYGFEALYPGFSRLLDDLSGQESLGEEETREVVRALVVDLLHESKKRDVTNLVVLVPGRADFDAPSAAYRWLDETLREGHGPFLDLLPRLQSRGVEAEALFLPGDPWHLGPEGNRMVGELIAGELRELLAQREGTASRSHRSPAASN